jgi:hypothetical protein
MSAGKTENVVTSTGATAPDKLVPGPARKTSLFKKILLVLAVIVIGFLVVVALQPADFRVARSATMAAPAEAVFEQVNDFHKWEAWSPWAKLDPAAKNSFEGPSSGTGAIFKWSGNSDVGEGKMTVTESRPSELIRIKLEFLKPFAATNTAEFTFKPAGDQTVVTWSMSGTKDFIQKGFCMFMNMDKMVGSDFEKGLTSMKAIVESEQKEE